MRDAAAPDDTRHKIDFWGGMRLTVFVIFYLLSFRLIGVYLGYLEGIAQILGIAGALAIALCTWLKPSWMLAFFLASIPLVNGLRVIAGGFPLTRSLRFAPLLGFLFACIYISWLTRRILVERKGIRAETTVDQLVDILAGVVVLSLVMGLWWYPLGHVIQRLATGPILGELDPFWGLETSYVFLEGLLFFRILRMEVKDGFAWEKIYPILYALTAITLGFSLIQLIFQVPGIPGRVFLIHSPFDDKHAYGSTLLLFVFPLLALALSGGQKRRRALWILLGLLGLFLVLSWSRATWLAFLLVGGVFLFEKVPRRLGVTAALAMGGALLFVNLFPSWLLESEKSYLRRLGGAVVVANYDEDANLRSRYALWKRTARIIYDYPLTGTGSGTFYRISRAYEQDEQARYKYFAENAHNYYLQVAAELGVPALMLFLAIIALVYGCGFHAVRRDEEHAALDRGLLYGLTAFLLTMLTSHPVLLSSQQFLFWAAMAALTKRAQLVGGGPPWLRIDHGRLKAGGAVFLAVLLGGHVYNHLASGKQLPDLEYGLYGVEKWNGDDIRWTMKQAGMRRRATCPLFGFRLVAAPENSKAPDGLKVSIEMDGKAWDEIRFPTEGSKPVYYYVPGIEGKEVDLKLKVNRTFKHRYEGGTTYEREQGVGLGEVSFLKIFPRQGVGFYGLEEELGSPGNEDRQAVRFRWTGKRASIEVQRIKDLNRPAGKARLQKTADGGIELMLKCGHPDISEKPVEVRVLGDARLIRTEKFENHAWRRIKLTKEELEGVRALTFEVSRTWNPKLMGISEDGRDLGVGVAFLKE